MSIIRGIALTLIASCYAFAVSVYTLDEQFALTNQTVLRFRIENNSSDTLNGVELRYRIVQNTSGIAEPDAYYLPGGLVNWVIEDSVNATLIVYFPNVILYPGDVLGGDAGFAIGLYNKDWSTWTKSDDPSQPASNTFTLANNVDVLSGGKSLMLDAGKYAGCPIVQFVEIKSDSLSLQVIQQLNTDASSIVIRNKDGQTVTANLNESVIDSVGQKIWRGAMLTQDTAELRGELRVECRGHILAYFAYGWEPTGAADAVKNSLWESAKAFVKADFDMGFNQGLGDGQRLALMKDSSGRYLDARRTDNWNFYRAWEEPGENPIPVIWSPVLMQYDENDIDSLMLEWSPLEDILWYHLVVLKDTLIGDSIAFIDTAVSLFTTQTMVKIPVLSPGKYIWYADPLVEVSMDEDGGDYYFVSTPQYKKLARTAIETSRKAMEIFLPVVSSAISEDTTMNSQRKKIRLFNPFGIFDIFEHVVEGTIVAKENVVKKNMTWLQETYKKEFMYREPSKGGSEEDSVLFNRCFTSEAFCAMKDTRMLAENWKTGFDSINWNKLFPRNSENGTMNKPVHNRCWLTMAQMLNHYFGGDIASDEILYYVRGGFRDTSGSNPIESMQAVNYALGVATWSQTELLALIYLFKAQGKIPSNYGWHIGTPTLSTIISAIDSGNVIGVSQINGGLSGGHAMVLNGYRIDRNGKVYIHLLNTDNMGTEEWRYYCSILGVDLIEDYLVNGIHIWDDITKGSNASRDMFFAFYIPPLNAHGRLANEDIFKDSDNDGIVDFDEKERFGTKPFDSDSDDDGIDDFDEIYDFMRCSSRSGNAVFERCYSKIGKRGLLGLSDFMECLSKLDFAKDSDFDGDGLNAAMDEDSDGDGYCDDQEVECDRFDASKHPAGVTPNCKSTDVALLAREKLSINDRSYCKKQDGTYCPIASFGTDFNDSYGVNIGVDASVGNVYSAKSVVLRDRAVVHGKLETAGSVVSQSSTANVTGATIENSANADMYQSVYAPLLNRNASNIDFTIQHNNVYNSGEVVFSSALGFGENHTSFSFNSGSELVFDQAVNLFAGSLNFQSGAKLNAPTGGSVTFHIGKNFQWNGEIVASDMVTAAQHIMVIYYGSNTVFVQKNFAGTIIAPNAEVVIGQVGKEFYGAIYAKRIIVHQETKVTWVPFVNAQASAVAINNSNLIELNYTVDFSGR